MFSDELYLTCVVAFTWTKLACISFKFEHMQFFVNCHLFKHRESSSLSKQHRTMNHTHITWCLNQYHCGNSYHGCEISYLTPSTWTDLDVYEQRMDLCSKPTDTSNIVHPCCARYHLEMRCFTWASCASYHGSIDIYLYTSTEAPVFNSLQSNVILALQERVRYPNTAECTAPKSSERWWVHW